MACALDADVSAAEAEDLRVRRARLMEELLQLIERVGGADAVVEQLPHQAAIVVAVPPEMPCEKWARRAAQIADENGSAGGGDTENFAEQLDRRAGVVENRVRDHQVEAMVRKGERVGVADEAAQAGGNPCIVSILEGLGEHIGGAVEGDEMQPGEAGEDFDGNLAGAGPYV